MEADVEGCIEHVRMNARTNKYNTHVAYFIVIVWRECPLLYDR